MKHLYRLRTQKLFEKNREKSSTGDVELEDDPYSITNIAFSADTRALAVTGITDQARQSEKFPCLIAQMQMFCHNFYSQWKKLFVECFESFAVHEKRHLHNFLHQVVLYIFSKKEILSEIACLEIPIIYEVSLDKNENSPKFDFPPRPPLR